MMFFKKQIRAEVNEMRKILGILVLGIFVFLFSALPSSAQGSKYELNGKTGILYPGSGFESGIIVELNFGYSFSKNIAMGIGAGFSNYHGPNQILIKIKGLEEYLESFKPLKIENSRIDQQQFTLKIIAKTNIKRMVPYFASGIGAYQILYNQTIFGTDPIEKVEIPLPVYFKKTFFGVNASGGVGILLNEFLSFKVECCYNKIFSDLIRSQIFITWGFGFNF